VPLLQASQEQIQDFMRFRGISGAYNGHDEKMLQQVANSAAEYKGLLYQGKHMM